MFEHDVSRWVRVAVVCVLASAAAAGCSTGSDLRATAVEQGDAAVGQSEVAGAQVDRTDRDAVIDAWGTAILTGDAETIARLIDPDDPAATDEAHRDALSGLPNYGEATVADLEAEIVAEGAESVE